MFQTDLALLLLFPLDGNKMLLKQTTTIDVTTDKFAGASLPLRITFIVRNSSCGKVMFLHLSVSHSVYRGCVSWQTPPSADTPATNPRDGHCISFSCSFREIGLLALRPLENPIPFTEKPALTVTNNFINK